MEFILLLVSSLLLTARAAAAASKPVLDGDGNKLRRDHLYYALSVVSPGGLTLAPPAPNAAPCPLNVAQAPFPDHLGRPLVFSPENTDDDAVQEGSTINIMFPEVTECPQSTVWTFNREGGVVTTGGSSSSTASPQYSRFAIRKVEDGASPFKHVYQIHVCPCSVGVHRPSCGMGCLGSLGLRKGEETIVLDINNERPHTVVFADVREVKTVSS